MTEIYFSINASAGVAGLADRTQAWSRLYYLGRSMDWIYIHRSLHATRSGNIFDFLGFNRLWTECSPCDAGIPSAQRIRVPIDQHDLGIEVHSLEDVQNWLAYQVRRRRRIKRLGLFLPWQWGRLYRECALGSREGGGGKDNKILVLLDQDSWWAKELFGAERFFRDFMKRLSMFLHRKGLWRKPAVSRRTGWGGLLTPLLRNGRREMSRRLRHGYDKARLHSPWPSGFASGKLKILVHVRCSEFGVIRTASGRFIAPHPKIVLADRLDDLSRENFSFSDISEIFSFLKGLVTRAGHDQLSIITASDGYRRTFGEIYLCQRMSPCLSETQLNDLKRMESTYEEKQFSRFSEISRTYIGESGENLRHLVDGLMRADIVVANAVGTTSRSLLLTYRAHEAPPPLFLLLCRPHLHSQILSGERQVDYYNTLPVNVAAPDFDLVEKRIREQMKLICRPVRSAS